jgi:hypothetical protein
MDDNDQIKTRHRVFMPNNNPNPSPSTRWRKGEPSPNPSGRPKGVASLYSKKLISDFAEHWQTHGKQAIERVFKENASFYLKIAVQLVPRELLISVSKAPEQMTDLELQQAAEEERLQQLRVIEHIKERVGEQIIEEAAREVMGEDGDDEDAT